jgi:hypothetical protein
MNDTKTRTAVVGPLDQAVMPTTEMGLKVSAIRCTWDGYEESSWVQYHDEGDPMPSAWDDEEPDEVVRLVLAVDADNEIRRLKAALRRVQFEAASLADAQVIALEALVHNTEVQRRQD